jgi:hypothetical protein
MKLICKVSVNLYDDLEGSVYIINLYGVNEYVGKIIFF